MSKVNRIIKYALGFMMMVPCIAQGKVVLNPHEDPDPNNKPENAAPFFFIPIGDDTIGAPVARVFGDTLYVYTTTDHVASCGPKDSPALMTEGYFYTRGQFAKSGFCNTGYTVYSTKLDPRDFGWKKHVNVLQEANVPWVYKPPGFSGAARMGAADAVQGDDGLYYLIFSAPTNENTYAIGAAVSKTPAGPFIPRPEPIKGTSHSAALEPEIGTTPGMDPSLIKLTNKKWAMFTANQTRHYYLRCDPSNTGINWQYINSNFTAVEKAQPVRNLIPSRSPYVRSPFPQYRSGNLYLHYAEKSGIEGFTIRQVVANSPVDPAAGFEEAGISIYNVDPAQRSNHASFVTFKGQPWVFYHFHSEQLGDALKTRKPVFSPVNLTCNGQVESITPYDDIAAFKTKLE